MTQASLKRQSLPNRGICGERIECGERMIGIVEDSVCRCVLHLIPLVDL
ncbi:MAG: hypothetical protein ACPHL6_01310 [Rubripirellula sp.]